MLGAVACATLLSLLTCASAQAGVEEWQWGPLVGTDDRARSGGSRWASGDGGGLTWGSFIDSDDAEDGAAGREGRDDGWEAFLSGGASVSAMSCDDTLMA